MIDLRKLFAGYLPVPAFDFVLHNGGSAVSEAARRVKACKRSGYASPPVFACAKTAYNVMTTQEYGWRLTGWYCSASFL